MSTTPTDPLDDVMSSANPLPTLRQRAFRGGVTLLVRGAGVKLIGLVAAVVVARFVTPHDLGLAALGLTLLVIGGLVADGGLGVGLLRRPSEPSPQELQSLLGLQLLMTTLLAVCAALLALFTGHAGLVTAAIVGTLPLYALRAPATVVSERRLDYGPVAAAEVAEAMAYAAAAMSLAVAGWGVWSIVVASVVRVIVGSAVLLKRAKVPLPMPRLDLDLVRPLLRFGAQFQSAGLVSVARDEGLNIVVATVGGVAVLGVWSLGRRCAQVAFVLFESLWRVSYPVFARLLEAGSDLRRDLDLGLRVTGAGTAVALVVVTTAAPALLPALTGPGWSRVPDVVAVSALGLLVSGPVSVTFSGYLYARGEAGRVVRCLALSASTWLLLAGALVPVLGVAGAAVGWSVSSWLETLLLTRAVRRSVPSVSLRGLRPAVAAAVVPGVPFWLVARSDRTAVVGVAVAVAAACCCLAVLAATDRTLVSLSRRQWTLVRDRA